MPGFQYTALGNSKSTTNILSARGRPQARNWNCICCHQYLWPWPQCHVSSESDCQASKQNYFGSRLNFRRRRREVLTCGPAPKTFETLEEVNQNRQNALQRPSLISGKVGYSLLSSVWGCFILIDFLLLGYFCQSVYQLDVAICSIN